MTRPAIATLITGSEKLTSVFGYWPAFHDAKVVELQLWRGDVNPQRNRYVFPVLTVRLQVWELTREMAAPGGLLWAITAST